MQLVHCTVAHAGDPRHTVRKMYASVPEVILLQAVHGADAVTEVIYATEREGVDELEYLRKNYGMKQEIFDLIDKLFPGANPSLPATMGSIKVQDAFLAEPSEDDRTKSYKERMAILAADKAARIKAARADRREVTEADEGVIEPPPAPRKVLAAKAALA